MRLSPKLLAVVALSTTCLPSFAEEKPTLQAYSVSVRKRLSKEDASIYYEERSGTRIQAVLSFPGKTMLAVDEKASKLEAYKDDLGTNLMDPKEIFGSKWIESFAFHVSEKGDRALTTFTSVGAPAKGAKAIVIKGTMSLLCGGNQKTIELKDLEIKPDPKAKLKIGDFTFTVEKSFGDTLLIKFESNSPTIRSASFAAEGQTITTDKPSRTRYGFDNKFTYGTSFHVRTKATKLNVSLTYFENIEAIDLPVDMSVGIGLE